MLAALLSACGGGGGGGSNGGGSTPPTAPIDPVPVTLFGVNVHWNALGDGMVEGGELIRDRSFRQQQTTPYWLPVANGGSVTFSSTDGDLSPAGGNATAGYVRMVRADAGATCVYQSLLDGVQGTAYSVYFSANAVSGAANVLVVLTDASYRTLAQTTANLTSTGWQHLNDSLTPAASATAMVGLCLTSAGTLDIDEVRVFRTAAPAIKTTAKTRLTELGVKSLRWPGGTLVDDFFWQRSVGPLLNRGELSDEFGNFETPSLGLHEFLNLCEELNLVPVIGVNVLNDAANAADLVEYILGSGTTPQGARRAANGRSAPWNVRYFELGNEPSARYAPANEPNAGSAYVAAARPVASAMRGKASTFGKSIDVSALSEATYQLADWLPGNPAPAAQMLANWNAQVMQPGSSGLVDSAQFVHGHFYAYDDRYAATGGGFPALMGSGELLRRMLTARLPRTRPIWITEYQVAIKDPINPALIDPAYTLDYQSGLVVADMLMTLVSERVAGAQVFNLSQRSAFGLLKHDADWRPRPAAQVFRLFAPLAGEERLAVTLAVTLPASYMNSRTLSIGVGTIPAGLTYAKVSAIATRTAAGKPRVLVINRDDATDVTVQLTVAGQGVSASVTRYQHANLSANNETGTVVSLGPPVTVSGTALSQLSVPRHSLVRVDFN
jgi:hypothetical protein